MNTDRLPSIVSLPTDSRIAVLVAVSVLWFLILFVRSLFPLLFETFQRTYGISYSDAGMLFSILMFSYALVQFPAGALSDSVGKVAVISIGAVIFAVSTILLPTASTFYAVSLLAGVMGVGSGVHKTVSISLLSKAFPRRQGLVLGFQDTLGQAGGMVAPLSLVAVGAVYLEWGSLFITAGVLVIALSGTLFLFERNTAETVASTGGRSVNETVVTERSGESHLYREMVRDHHLVVFTLVSSLYSFAWNAVAAFLPLYLVEGKALSHELASVAYSVLFAAGLGQVVSGRISDSVGELRLSAGLLGTTALVSLVLVRWSPTSNVAALVLVGLLGLGFHGFRPIRDSHFANVVPSAIAGGTIGIVRTAIIIVGSLGPVTIGIVIDRMGFDPGFRIVVAILSVASLLVVHLELKS